MGQSVLRRVQSHTAAHQGHGPGQAHIQTEQSQIRALQERCTTRAPRMALTSPVL